MEPVSDVVEKDTTRDGVEKCPEESDQHDDHADTSEKMSTDISDKLNSDITLTSSASTPCLRGVDVDDMMQRRLTETLYQRGICRNKMSEKVDQYLWHTTDSIDWYRDEFDRQRRPLSQENSRAATKPRKRKFLDAEQVGLFIDKLPNYYTALSIPSHMKMTRSSSDLVSKFIDYNPGGLVSDKSDNPCSAFDKVPAYYSSFANSTKYDEQSPLPGFLDDLDAAYKFESYSYPPFEESSEENAALCCEKSKSEESLTNTETMDSSSPSKHSSEQRCIVHVGRIPRTLKSKELRQLFEQFGDIKHCSVHIREHGDHYGFVTFCCYEDACAAVEGSRTIPECKNFDICFGGRRRFCQADYSDLDGNRVIEEEFVPFASSKSSDDDDFDDLLQSARERLLHR